MQLVLLDRIINERLTVRQTEDEISRLLNKNENDIPENINKYIEPEDEKIEEKHEEEINVPEVVNIVDDINPFQTKFQDNIRKIEENINNKEESFYDRIINEDLDKSYAMKNGGHIKFDDEDDTKSLIDSIINKEEPKEEKKISIIGVVNKVRDFVNEFDDKRIITKEEDFPDKYRITIEVEKDVN